MPIKEYRPSFSPSSTDSRRNAFGFVRASFRNTDTGVSRSAGILSETGTIHPLRACFLKSLGEGFRIIRWSINLIRIEHFPLLNFVNLTFSIEAMDETALVTEVAGSTGLFDLDEECVAVAVGQDFLNVLNVT